MANTRNIRNPTMCLCLLAMTIRFPGFSGPKIGRHFSVSSLVGIFVNIKCETSTFNIRRSTGHWCGIKWYTNGSTFEYSHYLENGDKDKIHLPIELNKLSLDQTETRNFSLYRHWPTDFLSHRLKTIDL